MKRVYIIISEHTEWLEHKRLADNNGEIDKYMKRIRVYSDKVAYGRYKDMKLPPQMVVEVS